MKDFFLKIDLAFHFVVILIIGWLVFGFFKLDQKLKDLPIVSQFTSQESSKSATIKEGCDKECEEKIEKEVSKAVAKIPTKTTKESTTTSTNKGTTYIPLNGSFSTMSTSWVDITSSDAYIKAQDYGSSPYISLEASIKTSHQNGKAFVRLYDVTNNIAVDGSELSSNSQTATQVSSPNLPFWSGNNLYRVQLKSLDGQEVSFSSGRVKIVSQ